MRFPMSRTIRISLKFLRIIRNQAKTKCTAPIILSKGIEKLRVEFPRVHGSKPPTTQR